MRKVAELMRPMFAEAGAPLPEKVRVTLSLTGRSKVIGRCYSPAASGDGATEILVRLDQEKPIEVAAILAHELAHAAVGVEHGHRKPFEKVIRKIGLAGKATATTAGPEFEARVAPMLAAAGAFPHAALNFAAASSGPKKQGTRLLKVECHEDGCGLVVRQTAKWIREVGPVHCPRHGDSMRAEGADDPSDN